MNRVRYIIASILLFFSAQSLALFMPEGGLPTGTERATASDSEGC